MNEDIIPAALAIFSFNFVMFFLVDRYCDFFFRFGSSWPPLRKELLNRPWFRKLARGAHIVFCVVALLLPFLVPKGFR